MISQRRLNSRMKNLFDVRILARTSDFFGADLSAAILATFGKRGTELTGAPQVFAQDFALDSSKQAR